MNSGAEADGVVRAARPDDAHPIAAVHVATWRDAYAGLLPDELLAGLDVGDWAGRWRGRLAAPAGGVFTLVFETDGRPRGFASGGPSRDEFPGGEVYAALFPALEQGGYEVRVRDDESGPVVAVAVEGARVSEANLAP